MTGHEEAAYLVFDPELKEEIVRLLSKPLADLGNYEVTREPEPVEVLRKFYDGKEVIGRLKVWEEWIGSPASEAQEALEQVLEFLRQGFWLGASSFPHQIHIRCESYRLEETCWILNNARADHYRADGSIAFTKIYPHGLAISKKDFLHTEPFSGTPPRDSPRTIIVDSVENEQRTKQ